MAKSFALLRETFTFYHFAYYNKTNAPSHSPLFFICFRHLYPLLVKNFCFDAPLFSVPQTYFYVLSESVWAPSLWQFRLDCYERLDNRRIECARIFYCLLVRWTGHENLGRCVLTCGKDTWTLKRSVGQKIYTFERKLLSRTYGPVQEKGELRRKTPSRNVPALPVTECQQTHSSCNFALGRTRTRNRQKWNTEKNSGNQTWRKQESEETKTWVDWESWEFKDGAWLPVSESRRREFYGNTSLIVGCSAINDDDFRIFYSTKILPISVYYPQSAV